MPLTQEQLTVRQREYDRKYREKKKAEATERELFTKAKPKNWYDECPAWYDRQDFISVWKGGFRYTRPMRNDRAAVGKKFF